jgi:serine/threonine protein kinase
LKDILANPPSWWTSTAKSIAIVGVLLGMRYIHRLGFAHGDLKPSIILFDANHRAHIVDFGSSRFRSLGYSTAESSQVGEDTDDEFPFDADLIAFASILFAILIDPQVDPRAPSYDEIVKIHAENGESPVLPGYVPVFVRNWIENGWSSDPSERDTAHTLLHTLRRRDFQVADGVDGSEVFAFVDSVEAFEY